MIYKVKDENSSYLGFYMKEKIKIEHIKNKIEETHPGAKLITKDYHNNDTILKILCENGHVYNTTWRYLQKNRWCKQCPNKKHTIENLIKFVKKHRPNSKIISIKENYLIIICSKNHKFKFSWENVKTRKWCKCLNKNNIETVIDYINSHHPNSKLLSKIYTNNHTKLKILCENNHVFYKSWISLKKGHWCEKCLNEKKLKEIISFIKKNHFGAKLLSKTYKNNKTHLNVICENGHNFYPTFSDIKNKKSWCPVCNKKKAEKYCRDYIENLFKKSFPQTKPKWLRNPKTGYLLELDGFCEELKIAFEYNGKQHYEYPNCFHKTKKQFEEQIYRDLVKSKLCEENKIILLKIKYFPNYKQKTINDIIMEEIKKYPQIFNIIKL